MRIASFMLVAALVACSPAAQPERAPEAPIATTAAAGDVAVVHAPLANTRVTSPLAVTGVAPAGWFFENQFPVRLLDMRGAEIAMSPATPRVSWTEPGDKEFDAELTFTVTSDTPATLVLEEDMPGEGNEPRQVRIPVVLTPAS